LLTMSKKSDVVDAGSGKQRANSTEGVVTKMDWRNTAKYVQIKLLTGLVSGGWPIKYVR